MTTGRDGAVAAVEAWLASGDSPEGVVVAHATGRAAEDADAKRWVRWILDGERDGSWEGDLLATAQALMALWEVREAAGLRERDPAVGRALDWLGSRRRTPGRWTDGCSPERHQARVCHHFAAGFFSPGPAAPSREEAVLTSGARVTGDGPVRFVASAVALRCLLLWREPGTDDGLHLEVLRRVAAGETPGLGTLALLVAAHTLLASPDLRDREAAGQALARMATGQRGDGSWPDADVFHAMEVYGAAAEAGVGGERIRKAVGHGARLLQSAQRDDGSWGPEHGPRRAFIGWTTFRAAR